MDINNLRKFFRLINSVAPTDQRRQGWFNTPCPLAPWTHDGGTTKGKSFGATVTPGISKVHCFSCNYSGTLGDLLHTYNNYLSRDNMHMNLQEASEMVEEEIELSEIDAPDYVDPSEAKEDVNPWPEDYLEEFESVFSSEEAIAYLKTRQITQRVAKLLDMRWDWKRARVCFPIRDYMGRLTGFHGRAVDPDDKLRYYAYGHNGVRNPIVWHGEQLLNPEKPILLVESVFDLASVLRVYKNSACAMFAGISKNKASRLGRLIEPTTEIVTLFDYGAGGDSARKAINILPNEITHLTPTKNQKDPGDMSLHELKDMLNSPLLNRD